MRRLATALLVVVAVVGLVVVAVVVLAPRPATVDGLRPVGDDPFGDADEIDARATDAVLSEGTGRLALLTGDGLALAVDGAVRPVTAPGTRVVDVAWFPNGGTLLVAEGPVPTGALAVVDADGTIRGSVPLSPSIGFGSGYGMAVAPGSRRAVVTAVDRPPLAGERRHLALVDLETGATQPLTEPGGDRQEERPFFLDASTVAYTETVAGSPPRPRLVSVGSGAITELGDAQGAVAGVSGSAVLVLDGRELSALFPARPSAPVRLGAIPSGTTLTSVDGSSGEAIVVDRRGRVRRVSIEPVTAPS